METLSDIQTLSAFHKSVTCKKTPQINSLKKTDGTYSMPGTDTAKTLTRTHFPLQTLLMKTLYSNHTAKSEEIHNADYEWITHDLIVQVMLGFQAKTTQVQMDLNRRYEGLDKWLRCQASVLEVHGANPAMTWLKTVSYTHLTLPTKA